MPNKEAAKRALDIIENLGGAADDFRRKWLTIHAFSTEFSRNNQRYSLIDSIEASVPDREATNILNELSIDINYLYNNPVGDLRLDDSDPEFYQNAQQDIAQVRLEDRQASNRLGHLICVVYQVRCNTEHGRKQLGTERSQKLFTICNSILDKVIPILTRESDTA